MFVYLPIQHTEMSDHSKSSSSENDHSFEFLALPYEEFDVLVSDIDEKELVKIGKTYEVEHLSAGTFTSPAFLINGKVYGPNMRFMISLVCQRAGKSNSKAVNIWFLVNTGSPFTCLTTKSLEVFFGQGNIAIDDSKNYPMAIQDQNSEILCRISKAHYKEVNILGVDAIRDLELSAIEGINWQRHTFRLSKQ
ncbi:hypothetical protein FO519_009625 [Halicephalobus sp. NKZ332]|nr:hypothetical protein FO519_009625 [Halicephalobus sp. NKZ332]